MPLRIKNGCIKAKGISKDQNINILTDNIKKVALECKESKKDPRIIKQRKYIIF